MAIFRIYNLKRLKILTKCVNFPCTFLAFDKIDFRISKNYKSNTLSPNRQPFFSPKKSCSNIEISPK